MTSVSPAREAAAARIGESIGDRPTALRSIPDFKSTEAFAYPLVRDGRQLVSIPAQGDDDEAGRAARDAAEADATALVVICDELFETVTGAPCGGPAEDGEIPPAAASVPRSIDGRRHRAAGSRSTSPIRARNRARNCERRCPSTGVRCPRRPGRGGRPGRALVRALVAPRLARGRAGDGSDGGDRRDRGAGRRASTPPAKGREDPGAGWADVTEVVTDEVGRKAWSVVRSAVWPFAVAPPRPGRRSGRSGASGRRGSTP